jgi:hypothetical protein
MFGLFFPHGILIMLIFFLIIIIKSIVFLINRVFTIDLSMKNKKIFERWIFTTNHKRIGILYLLFGFFNGMLAVLLSMIMRSQLAFSENEFLFKNYNFLYNIKMMVIIESKKKMFLFFSFLLLYISIYLEFIIDLFYLISYFKTLTNEEIFYGLFNDILYFLYNINYIINYIYVDTRININIIIDMIEYIIYDIILSLIIFIISFLYFYFYSFNKNNYKYFNSSMRMRTLNNSNNQNENKNKNNNDSLKDKLKVLLLFLFEVLRSFKWLSSIILYTIYYFNNINFSLFLLFIIIINFSSILLLLITIGYFFHIILYILKKMYNKLVN